MDAPDTPVPVASTILERDGEVLLVEETKSGVAGTWNLPGGHVEADETPPATARREAAEEAGVDVTLDALVGVFFEHDDAVGGTVANHVFTGETSDDADATEDDTVAAVHWAPVDAGLPLRGRSVRAALDEYRAGTRIDLDVFHDVRTDD